MSTYTINLYIHGVPSGQDVWGLRDSNGPEAQYIRSFYGQGLDGKSQMYVDIRQYDGRTSSYYTYKQDKTIDNTNNRPGGYCAITLRIDNYYYADIQNMFNLLKAAFDTTAATNGVRLRFRRRLPRKTAKNFPSRTGADTRFITARPIIPNRRKDPTTQASTSLPSKPTIRTIRLFRITFRTR